MASRVVTSVVFIPVQNILISSSRNKYLKINFILEYSDKYNVLNKVSIAFLMDCVCFLASGGEKVLYFTFVRGKKRGDNNQ